MNEQLLQYLWQYQLYNKKSLTLDNGDGNFHVIHPGQYNPEQGSCFTKAKIQFDDTLWGGNVLVNVKISDWLNQRKENDRSYDYILMHIVWEYDQHEPKIKIPVLSLKSRITQSQLEKAKHLMNLESMASWDGSLSDNEEPVIKEEKKMYENRNKRRPIILNGVNNAENNNEINENEVKIINCLHELLDSLKKKPR